MLLEEHFFLIKCMYINFSDIETNFANIKVS